MNRLVLAGVLLLVVLGIAGAHLWGGRPPSLQLGSNADDLIDRPGSYYGATFDPPRQAPDFVLYDQYGDEYRLHEQRGNVVVMFFGYTSCPDVCPGTLAQYRHVKRLLQEKLEDAADRVQFVFVTVDPQRDTQKRLREYISLFDSDFKGLWADADTLQQVWRDYGIIVERVDAPESSAGYLINHSATSYVLDAQGNLRLVHFYGMADEQVAHDLEQLILEAKAL